MSSTDRVISNDELLQIFLACPVITKPFTLQSNPDMPSIPFGRVQAEDIVKIIYEHPQTEEFFFGLAQKPGDLTNADMVMAFVELLARLGSATTSKIISLATPWPLHPGMCKQISQWSAGDRLRAVNLIREAGDWDGFFDLLSSWMSKSSTSSSVTQGDPMKAALEAAVATASTPEKSPPNSSSNPDSPTQQLKDSPSTLDAPQPLQPLEPQAALPSQSSESPLAA